MNEYMYVCLYVEILETRNREIPEMCIDHMY